LRSRSATPHRRVVVVVVVVARHLTPTVCRPAQVTLLRGNHEDAQVNALYGFRAECLRRCTCGEAVWRAANAVFEMMPIAATIDSAVLCIHGGVGASIHSIDQLKTLPRPARVELRAQCGPARVLVDALWSDPTDLDEHSGGHLVSTLSLRT